jgi:hypothetical protein
MKRSAKLFRAAQEVSTVHMQQRTQVQVQVYVQFFFPGV